MEGWVRSLAEALDHTSPGSLRLQCPVERISRIPAGFELLCGEGRLQVSAVLLTLPLEESAALLPATEGELLLAAGAPPRATVAVQH